MSSFCLREANVLDESGEFTCPLDVIVVDGRGRTMDAPSLDAAGLFLRPGIFDCHDHLTMSTADPAKATRVPVAAHAYGGDGLTNSVEAGARSIEHGGFLTEEQAALMAERGCWPVPTLSTMRDCLRFAADGIFTPTQCEKILSLGLDPGACTGVFKDGEAAVPYLRFAAEGLEVPVA